MQLEWKRTGRRTTLRNEFVFFRFQLLMVVMLYCALMFSGINHVVFYSDEIFKTGGIPENVVTYVTIGVFTLQALGSLVGVTDVNQD